MAKIDQSSTRHTKTFKKKTVQNKTLLTLTDVQIFLVKLVLVYHLLKSKTRENKMY